MDPSVRAASSTSVGESFLSARGLFYFGKKCHGSNKNREGSHVLHARAIDFYPDILSGVFSRGRTWAGVCRINSGVCRITSGVWFLLAS